MNAPLYTIEVLRLAASLPDQVALDEVHGRAEERSATCGSVVSTAVQLDKDGRVAAISQKVQACAFGQASAAAVAAHAAGRTRAEVEAAMSDLLAWLDGGENLPSWPEIEALKPARTRKSRHNAVLLPFKALLSAMKASAR
jgi:NifU-like protein involved in Fe-S cluster formation